VLDPAFNKPIPGSSLTNKEKGFAFERPPAITNADEAVMMHIERLSEEEMVNGMIDVLDAGVDIVTLTKGILRSAVAEGVHSIDISLMIAPVIHELIKTTAIQAGVDYEEGFDNPDKDRKRSHMRVMQEVENTLAKRKFRPEKDQTEEAMSDPMSESKEQPSQPEPVAEPMEQPPGFMSPRPAPKGEM